MVALTWPPEGKRKVGKPKHNIEKKERMHYLIIDGRHRQRSLWLQNTDSKRRTASWPYVPLGIKRIGEVMTLE